MNLLNNYNGRPEINYPCRWSYKIIGSNAEKLLEAIDEASCGIRYNVSLSNVSKNAKYFSLNLTMEVPSEFIRDLIFQKLGESEHIKFIL